MSHGKAFVITVKIKDVNFVPIENQQIYLIAQTDWKEENRKAIIRGAFMGSGSVNNPEKEYHLEVDLANQQNLEVLVNMLQKLDIRVKTFKSSIYIKEGEEISKFLALIGAGKAVMQFEEIRIQKEMRGKVNRLVNCETANLNKTINASIRANCSHQKIARNRKISKAR